jgi:hypothetical protein
MARSRHAAGASGWLKMHTQIAVIVLAFSAVAFAHGQDEIRAKFDELNHANWQLAFADACTDDWRKSWTLDGERATIRHSAEGMDFRAGPIWKDDACHAVLWTKDSFEGDLKIDYEYTRTDDAERAVTILYIQATGSGLGPYAKDIAAWSNLRKVPAMNLYWGNMNAYHISYAAFGASKDDPESDYLRARRYLPGPEASLRGTELKPDYFARGLFDSGAPHRITVIKVGDELYMQVRTADRAVFCHWKNNSLPVTEGRIGLRHMYTRAARYRDFRVHTRP